MTATGVKSSFGKKSNKQDSRSMQYQQITGLY